MVQNRPKITRTKRVIAGCAAPFLIAVFFLGCVNTEKAADPNMITVEGRITARGSTPLQTYMIETDDRNTYVLAFPEEAQHAYTGSHRYRVVGELYKSDWSGMPMAHLRVREVTDISN